MLLSFHRALCESSALRSGISDPKISLSPAVSLTRHVALGKSLYGHASPELYNGLGNNTCSTCCLGLF